MNKIYFGTKDGDLISDFELRNIAFIVTGEKIPCDDIDASRSFAKKCRGIKGEIKKPSVKYLVEHGHKVKATMIYRDSHDGISLKDAKEAVDKMEEEMKNKH